MIKEVIVPRLGSSDDSDEVRVLQWLKSPGEGVKKGEGLLEVETDKVNVEIESPEDGILKEVRAQTGEFVKFNAVVAIIDTAA